MSQQSSITAVRSALAWLVLAAATLIALWLLYGAAFSAWMSGGPPNPYPQGWAMRSQAQLVWSAAVAAGGFAAFRLLREWPVIRRSTIAAAVVAIALALVPGANRFILVDRCFDSGGRWNYEGLQCER